MRVMPELKTRLDQTHKINFRIASAGSGDKKSSTPQLIAIPLLKVVAAIRRDLLAESKKHKATKLLCQIPSIGPIRAALLIALIQTPHRFRTKRPLWKYSGHRNAQQCRLP